MPFQTVVNKGQKYCLTTMGFELNMALVIMKAIVNTVLGKPEPIQQATSYIDNIY